MPTEDAPPLPDAVTLRYEEFEVGATVVAMLEDPADERAWIQSDTTVAVLE